MSFGLLVVLAVVVLLAVSVVNYVLRSGGPPPDAPDYFLDFDS